MTELSKILIFDNMNVKLEAQWAEPVLLTFHSVEETLCRTFHMYFLPNFSSFGQPKSTNQKQELPYLLTNRDKISNLDRGPSIDASYQVSVHLARPFQNRRFLEIDQSETRITFGGHAC